MEKKVRYNNENNPQNTRSERPGMIGQSLFYSFDFLILSC